MHAITFEIETSARYQRFSYQQSVEWWAVFKSSMEQIIMQRLKQSRATVFWKEYAPSHFGGRTGTFTGLEESLRKELPVQPDCPPASYGETW
jgi:hypothetical protein